MKSLHITLAAALLAASSAGAETVVLDLTKASTALEFDATNGSWTGTYNEDAESIDSQVFSFIHNSMDPSYKTWWGFTASNMADNSRKDDYITYQFSNMNRGGIVLNDDGTVKTDAYGAPEVSADVPYIVGYYNAYMSRRPCDLTFTDGKAYRAKGMYVNLNSYAYYNLEEGNAFSRAFTNGDKFTLTIHGVSPDGSEKTIDVILSSYTNGDLTINRTWRYVDLTPLGIINELYFTMTSTDTGTWGMNTPGYFCIDKLTVESKEDGVESIGVNPQTAINYDRASKTVTTNGGFTMVYDAVGNAVMSTEDESFSIAHLSAGVYIVRSGNATLKIAK